MIKCTMELRRMEWEEMLHASVKWEKLETLDGKPERKMLHRRHKRRRKDNSEIDVKGVGFDGFVCMGPVGGLLRAGNFMTGWAAV